MIDLNFSQQTFDVLVGGQSVLDIPKLDIQDLDQAEKFIKSYGFDFANPEHLNLLWGLHKKTIHFLRKEILTDVEWIPESVADPNRLKDLRYLLIYASSETADEDSLKVWSCAILRVIHVLVHLENDLFTRFSGSIQEQVLNPFRDYLSYDHDRGFVIAAAGDPERIPLKSFDAKPFKSSESSVVKLLAKPDAVAFSLLDKIGVRFVTKHLTDVFRLMRFLLNHHLVSFPHMIPDQSNNTLFPVNLMFEVMEELGELQDIDAHEVDRRLSKKIEDEAQRAVFKEKLNHFSGRDYKFMKFIARRLIRVKLDGQEFSFFYPYEVQIVDHETHLKNSAGQASHSEYKKRQIQRARLRVLGPQASKGIRPLVEI